VEANENLIAHSKYEGQLGTHSGPPFYKQGLYLEDTPGVGFLVMIHEKKIITVFEWDGTLFPGPTNQNSHDFSSILNDSEGENKFIKKLGPNPNTVIW
jgi:hypothetical protein